MPHLDFHLFPSQAFLMAFMLTYSGKPTGGDGAIIVITHFCTRLPRNILSCQLAAWNSILVSGGILAVSQVYTNYVIVDSNSNM